MRRPVIRMAAAAVLAACASSKSSTAGGGTAAAPVTRLADRDRPALPIRGDTTSCAGEKAVQFLDVKNPTPREVTVAAHTPNGLAPLSADNLLRPFEKKRYVFPAAVRLTGISAWTIDPGMGIGRNATQMIDVEPKRSCGAN